MKRCWFGFGLLVVMFVLSLAVTARMEGIHQPMAEDISQAAVRAMTGDWGNAEHLLTQTRNVWEQNWGLSASFFDHEPMETINALFCQLEVAAALRDGPDFASLCAHLAAELDAMGDAHGFVWWNLL